MTKRFSFLGVAAVGLAFVCTGCVMTAEETVQQWQDDVRSGDMESAQAYVVGPKAKHQSSVITATRIVELMSEDDVAKVKKFYYSPGKGVKSCELFMDDGAEKAKITLESGNVIRLKKVSVGWFSDREWRIYRFDGVTTEFDEE